VFEWYKRFSGGREDVEDDKLSGRPVTVKTDENVEKARTVMRTDRHHDSGRGEFWQRNNETNFINKFEHEGTVIQNGPKESASFYPENKPQHSKHSTY
jgi:hypothetical protein